MAYVLAFALNAVLGAGLLWLTVKVVDRRNSRNTFKAALLVGLYDGRRLRFVGKVGTGFTQQTLDILAAKLDRLRTERPPFDPPPRIRDATWVRPKLVAQLAYAEWTADGKLRQPAFLGLRTDKHPAEVTWSQRER